jgi:hypothetical protein
MEMLVQTIAIKVCSEDRYSTYTIAIQESQSVVPISRELAIV